MNNPILQTFVIFLVFLIIDRIYLHMISNKVELQIFDVQKSPLIKNDYGTMGLNLILILAIYNFLVLPRGTLIDAFVLGIIMQGTMNATNYTVFSNWSLNLAVKDTIMGGLMTLFALLIGRNMVKLI